MARRAKGFDMKIIYYDAIRNEEAERTHGIEFKTKEEVVRESDYLSVHVPFTPETKNSIGAGEFKMMKKTAYIINTARGGVVDERALVEALQRGDDSGGRARRFREGARRAGESPS